MFLQFLPFICWVGRAVSGLFCHLHRLSIITPFWIQFSQSFAGRTTLTPRVSAALAEHHLQLPPPVLAHRDQLPLHLRRKIAQHRLVGRMNAQRRRRQQQPRRQAAKPPRRRSTPAARRPTAPSAPCPPPAAGPRSAPARESSSPAPAAADADPRPPSAQSPPAARRGPASAGPASRGRRSKAPAPAYTAGRRRSPGSSSAIPARSSRLQPSLRLQPVQRIGVRSVRMPARKQPRQQLAAQLFVLLGQRRLVGSRAKGHLVFARKAIAPQTHAAPAQTPAHAAAAPPRSPSWPAPPPAPAPPPEPAPSAGRSRPGSAQSPQPLKTHEPAATPDCPYRENPPPPALRCARPA